MDFKLVLSLTVMSMCNCITMTNGANILIVMPLPFKSHFKTFQPLFEETIRRGYNVTLISNFHLDNQFQSNYTLINVEKYCPISPESIMPIMVKQSRLRNFLFCYEFSTDLTEKFLRSPEVRRIIHSKDRYDLVIVELFCADGFFAFGPKFNAPLLSLTSQSLLSTHNWIIGNPFPSSYVPNGYLPLTEKMSLISRIINAGFSFVTILNYEFVFLFKIQKLIEQYFDFDQKNVPHIKTILKNISVSLVNSHYSFEYPKPHLPNVVNVAGVHFTHRKPLPERIRKFMDEAEHGVIYFSLGSIVTPSSLESLGKLLITTVESLPQRLLMKWDRKLLPYVPKNVLVEEWLPQTDIMNHPNCRLFITHGGLLSLLESLNASVPVLGIPVFGDQFYNMAMVEYFEIGQTLLQKDISEELLTKINEVLSNPKYKLNMKKRSSLFRERLTSPLDTALHWIDHLIKHKDTSHLNSAASQLTWYELYSLDVLMICAIFVSLVAYILKYIIFRLKIKFIGIQTKLITARKSNKLKTRRNLKCD